MKRVLLAALLVVSTLALPMAVGQDATDRDARLAIEQPTGIDEPVTESTVNGSTLYEVNGVPVDIAPRNFEHSDVVDYGVETGNATLDYDSDFGKYEFTTSTQGTYSLYWIVTERIAVNGTNATETVQRRYEAQIRVSGGTNLVTQSAGSISRMRADARKWRDWNGTLNSLDNQNLYLISDQSTAEKQQTMLDLYVARGAPHKALSGGLVSAIIIIGSTVGGLLLFLMYQGYHTRLLLAVKGQLNRFEVTEAAEGKMAERIERREQQERVQKGANTDPHDVSSISDYWGDLITQEHGPNFAAAYENLFATFGTMQPFRDHLAAMDKAGYVAVVERDGDEIVAAEVVDEAETEDDADVVSLADASDELILAIDHDTNPVSTFDPQSVDIDEIKQETPTLDVGRFAEFTAEDVPDQQGYAQAMRDFVAGVEAHDYTDETGRVKADRSMLNAYLSVAHEAEGIFHLPGARRLRENLEAALERESEGEKAAETVERIRSGRGAGGD